MSDLKLSLNRNQSGDSMAHNEDCDRSSPPIKEGIEQQGFYVCNFEAEDCCPAFSYTVGLRVTQNHPDFLTMGLSVEMNSYLVVEAAEKVKSGKIIEPNHEYDDFLDGVPVRFVTIQRPHMQRHFGFAREYYDTDQFKALQIVWPDKQGRWPWDEGCDEALAYCQKLLDRDPHFAFYSPTNLVSFCSRGVFEKNLSIYDVVHQANGEWQFISNEPCTPENIMLVCLEEVVKQDPTINELYDLPYGKRAWREKVGGKWTIEDYEEDDDEGE